jgi:hypothetical protein
VLRASSAAPFADIRANLDDRVIGPVAGSAQQTAPFIDQSLTPNNL